MADVGIIGAGIAGLTAAYRLRQEGVSVQILEASPRTGGMIRTERTDGYLVEHGPNSLRGASSTLVDVIQELGLTNRVVPATGASTRYVVRDGTPTALPSSLWSFLTTDLLSTRAKLRLLGEPFIPSGNTPSESVAQFVRRRLGDEVLDYAVNPFVGGIFAGDPEQLSVEHAFERLFEMERDYGSLFRGMISSSRGDNGRDVPASMEGVFSFERGLQTLPDALADVLEDRILYNAPVTALRQDEDRWHVASAQPDGSTRMDFFDALICTVPLHRFRRIDFETTVDLSPLEDVTYPPLSVLALGLPREDVAHPLDGFGMLVPEVEDDLEVLGTIFASSLFPNRTPDGHVLLASFVGGMRAPDLGTLQTQEVQSIVMRDLEKLLGVTGSPSFVRHVTWSQAIPQYDLDYERVASTLQNLERSHPGLFLAGNFRSGISVGDAMDSADRAAREAKAVVEAMVAP